MIRPTVSVIIPTFNRASLLPRAIDSVVAQSMPDWELVVVDDGSTDETPQLADAYGRRLGDRWRYCRQVHAGASAARNHGIETCRGELVCFLDSDDEFLPQKLARQLELFERFPELGLVYGDYSFVDLLGVRHASAFDGHLHRARAVSHRRVGDDLCICTGDLFDELLQGYFIPTIVGMVRRDVLAERIRFDESLSYAEEWLFYLQVVRTCRAGFVNEPVCLHHHTTGSLARGDRRSNVLRQRRTLDAIRRTFAGQLTRSQRRELNRQLSHSCDQLAYDAHRAAEHLRAAGFFLAGLRLCPDLRRAAACASELAASITRCVRSRGAASDSVSESSVVVR